MEKQIKIETLKEEIEKKRSELNKIIIEGTEKDRILSFSQELDILISRYCSNQLKK